MSLSIETKKAVVEEIVAGIGNAQTMVLAEYRGISVASMTELRANARKEGVYLRVLKTRWLVVRWKALLLLGWLSIWLARWYMQRLKML